jgi:hypothetical protein
MRQLAEVLQRAGWAPTYPSRPLPGPLECVFVSLLACLLTGPTLTYVPTDLSPISPIACLPIDLHRSFAAHYPGRAGGAALNKVPRVRGLPHGRALHRGRGQVHVGVASVPLCYGTGECLRLGAAIERVPEEHCKPAQLGHSQQALTKHACEPP